MSHENTIGQMNYLQGRALGVATGNLHLADFHDIIALAFYGEDFVSICEFIRMRIHLEAHTPVL